MNKQILKLAEQAGMYVDLDGKPWPKWMGAEECEVAYAQFAELIVRECIDIVGAGGEFASRPKLVEKLQEHFGVEE